MCFRVALLVLLVSVAFPAGPAEAQWETIAPGGDTVCSDGSPWKFFVHRGDPGKLLVEFEGGGACWSGATCELDIYTRRVTVDPELARQQGLLVGIYDRDNPENPFRDWTHVYVPYCTGDLHWGSAATTHTGSRGEFVVQHKGAVNAATALAWTAENVPAPSQVFVAGCSAGGYGAIFWAPRIAAQWPAARLAHLSDSAAGVVAPGLFSTLLPAWNAAAAWPGFVTGLDLAGLDPAAISLPQMYDAILAYNPGAGFAQFNTTFDATQIFFYGISKNEVSLADAATWSAQMQAHLARIELNPNFSSYLAAGTEHCVINRAEFYTTTVGDRRLVDFVRELAETGSAGRVR
ncbi:MAG: pectinacetylesterase family protein [Vicinamibacteria bacterium]|nr:pectinacetylesterase family protein [Vicinamibacteria bacterium]